jgi:hypothetical protein
VDNGVVIDGKLIVPQSITAGTIDTRGLSIRDSAGNVILAAGSALATDYAAAGTKNNELVPSIQAAATSTFTAAPGLMFDFDVDYMGWYGANGATLSPGAGFIVLSSANNDPMLMKDFVGIPGSQYDKIRMRVRRTQGSTGAGWDGTLFTNREGTDAALSLANPNLTNAWQILEWDMSKVPAWAAQTTTHIRIDLGTTPQDKFDIDWIAIGKYAAAPSVGAVTDASKTADWATGLAGRPADTALLNSAVSLGDDGALRGAGGGQVSLSGMGVQNLRVFAYSNTAGTRTAGNAGVYLNGMQIPGTGYYRSYNLVVLRRSDLAIVKNDWYDVYGAGESGGRSAGDLANWLNAYANAPGQYIIILYTADEPANHRGDAGLPDAIYRNGGSRAVFMSPNFKSWSTYVLVSISGCGEGNGAQAYRGDINGDPAAWCEVSFNIQKGNISGIHGANFMPKDLAAFGYTGDLDATKGANSSNLNVGVGGRNLFVNSLPNSAANFSGGFFDGAYAGDNLTYVPPTADLSVWSPDRRGCVYMRAMGPVGGRMDIYTNPNMTVNPGKRYEASVALSTHRCRAYVNIAWYRADGSYIAESSGNNVDHYMWNASSSPEAPPRSLLIATAPADARTAMVFVRTIKTFDANSDMYTFAAQWYFGEAMPAQAVGSPYSPGLLEARDLAIAAQTALQTKIDANASSILRAPITITTGGGVVVGSLMYNATNGLYGSGRGVAITPYGLIGHNGSKYTFGVNGTDGTAFFGGELQASYGTFGALRVAPGGYIANGNYDGSWRWPGNGRGGGFQISERGFLAGNADDPNFGYFLVEFTSGTVAMPGFTYAGRQLTLDAPAIVNPKLTLADRTVSIVSPSGQGFSHPRATTGGYCGSHTASISNATSPSYLWTSADNPWGRLVITNPTSATCGISVVGPGGRNTDGTTIDTDFYLTCTVSDGGVTKSATIYISVSFY